jgi:hypothetical protein
MTGLLFVIALLATGLLHPTGGGHAHSVGVPDVIVAVVAVLAGLCFGRIRGLRQPGNPTSEYAFMMPGESAAVAQVNCPPGGKSGKNQEEEA